MTATRASRRRALYGALALAAIIAAASVGYTALAATNNTYTGCLKGGQISNVAIGESPASACGRGATQISWSQTGPAGTNGTNGVSVTSATEPAGANCANGGSRFTAANNSVTYACNGADTQSGGVSTINDLDGTDCGVGLTRGTFTVDYSNSGDVTFHCHVVAGHMHLTAGHLPGNAGILVDNVFGLVVGAVVTIDEGANQEVRVVQEIGETADFGTFLLLDNGLSYSHLGGTPVSFQN